MRIVADENIPLLDEFFADFGSITRQPGRSIDPAAVATADVLLVRSVTQVNQQLLQGSAVRFVGTCTIGTDHLDLDYFQQANIAWSSAPGCNARGVVDYVLSSLLVLAQDQALDLSKRTYGIVGAGQVGSRLQAVLQGLGWTVLVCDPPRQLDEGGDFVSLQQIITECDVISLHTPLDKTGEHPTHHLLNAENLSQLQRGAWLINASRGPVIDNLALRQLLVQREDLRAVLDVWEAEPTVDAQLAALCRIATPHIAGYSLDGKLRGTAQIYSAFCAFMGQPEKHRLDDLMPAPWLSEMRFAATVPCDWLIASICHAVYDPRRDDADFRLSLIGDELQQRAAFDALRKNYPMRREIEGLKVSFDDQPSAELARVLQALGVAAR
ncbi:4-phosphoerythronate dehydrogenase PdxB [Pseudomonas sp. M30-35]|uniref:4-phosphoerythronate dehydrogenase PdxB n=1 Tax=Pseudomonas sp. M30-35 TaxID=1981174 RepID=UPI000B3C482A|nr:4-phosphoerythronate dehydrogenase PdxB [Pseudomonas sp. M30-35]ARU88660.1 4-phosphoerythronate dehydrogenase [Pseudomonas sp. M30-35]